MANISSLTANNLQTMMPVVTGTGVGVNKVVSLGHHHSSSFGSHHYHHHTHYHQTLFNNANSNTMPTTTTLVSQASSMIDANNTKLIVRPFTNSNNSSTSPQNHSSNNVHFLAKCIVKQTNNITNTRHKPNELKNDINQQMQLTTWNMTTTTTTTNTTTAANANGTVAGGNGNLVIFATSNHHQQQPTKKNPLPITMVKPAILIQAEKKPTNDDNEVKPFTMQKKTSSNSTAMAATATASNPLKRIKIETEKIEVQVNPKRLLFTNPTTTTTNNHKDQEQKLSTKQNLSSTGTIINNEPVVITHSFSGGIVNRLNSFHNDPLPDKIFDSDDEDEDEDDDLLSNYHHLVTSLSKTSQNQQTANNNLMIKLETDVENKPPPTAESLNESILNCKINSNDHGQPTSNSTTNLTIVSQQQQQEQQQQPVTSAKVKMLKPIIQNVVMPPSTQLQTIQFSNLIKLKNSDLLNMLNGKPTILTCNNGNIKLTGQHSFTHGTTTNSMVEAPTTAKLTINPTTAHSNPKIVQVKSIAHCQNTNKIKKVKTITTAGVFNVGTVKNVQTKTNDKKCKGRKTSQRNKIKPNSGNLSLIATYQQKRKEIWANLLNDILDKKNRIMANAHKRRVTNKNIAIQCQILQQSYKSSQQQNTIDNRQKNQQPM